MGEALTFENISELEDPELQRIEDFQKILPNIGRVTVSSDLDMSATRPATDAINRFIEEQRIPGTTLYLTSEYAEGAGDTELLGFEPYVSTGSKTSGHGVFFGSLYFSDGRELEVAVKPHDAKSDEPEILRKMEVSCLGDFYKNLAAHEARFDGLVSVGFIVNEGGVPYSLTLLDPDISTLDSLDWTVFHREGHETTGMRQLWDKASILVADLHDQGDSIHGDLAPRNFATRPEGQLELIDWELGNITNSSSDQRTRARNTYKDLRKLMFSMLNLPNVGKMSGVDMFREYEGDWWEGFKDVFFDGYSDWRMALAQNGSHTAKKSRMIQEELADVSEKLRIDTQMLQMAYRETLAEG